MTAPPFYTGPARAVSLQVDAESEPITHATLTPTATLPVNTGVTYFLSNNGGLRWFQVRPRVSFSFPTTGTDLRWRAELRSLSPALTPRVEGITIAIDEYRFYFPIMLNGWPDKKSAHATAVYDEEKSRGEASSDSNIRP